MNQTESSPIIDQPAALLRARYVSLRTYRKDGSSIDCPVWFAFSDDGTQVWFRSRSVVGKLARIVRQPRVELRPCSWRGVVHPDAPVLTGSARMLDSATDHAVNAAAEAHLHRRYGWQWYSLHLFRLPFTHTVKVEMTFRQKWATIRAQRPLDDSQLVAVTLGGRGSGLGRRPEGANPRS